MRICFELLEMLKAHKKGIRRATVNTFGYIAKAIGPQDVLHTLLNNLKVQERQNRVCTTVAIAIVAETCSPFTVLPALMNEYRVPELNVQNGVLKAMSFMFEYIGEMGKDYIYAVTPLLQVRADAGTRAPHCAKALSTALGIPNLKARLWTKASWSEVLCGRTTSQWQRRTPPRATTPTAHFGWRLFSLCLAQDALMDRDLVHRQTASTTVKHIALGVAGLGCEDALVHLLNYVFPNIFETSPHVIGAVFDAIEGCRWSLGVPTIMSYTMQGLFHPARRVREVYWKIYNNTYIYDCDALTAAYPRLEDDGVNQYRRTHLEMML